MKKPLSRRAVAVAIGVAGLPCAATVQATLQDRDLDGDTVTDAFYDTVLDITWLRNANVNGSTNWDAAVAWAEGYSIAGYSDWRLPVGDVCGGSPCLGTEMGHLYFDDGISTRSPGGFQNLAEGFYWSGTTVSFDGNQAWAFSFGDASQSFGPKMQRLFPAMAVATGDIAAVPEPATLLLMLGGAALLALSGQRRRRQQTGRLPAKTGTRSSPRRSSAQRCCPTL